MSEEVSQRDLDYEIETLRSEMRHEVRILEREIERLRDRVYELEHHEGEL